MLETENHVVLGRGRLPWQHERLDCARRRGQKGERRRKEGLGFGMKMKEKSSNNRICVHLSRSNPQRNLGA